MAQPKNRRLVTEEALEEALEEFEPPSEQIIAGVLDEGDPFPSAGIFLIRPAE